MNCGSGQVQSPANLLVRHPAVGLQQLEDPQIYLVHVIAPHNHNTDGAGVGQL